MYKRQDELYLGKMDAEGMIRATAEMGAEGVEIISEAIIPNFPNPPESWINQWFQWMDEYKAVSYTHLDVYKRQASRWRAPYK